MEKKKILLIDNYDSFSYNLYQYIGETAEKKWGRLSGRPNDTSVISGEGCEIRVIRNDELSIEQIQSYSPDYIIISPGPGRPADAGVCEEVITKMAGKAVIMGVCLGHQAICEAFGATVTYASELMHGKQSIASLDNDCPVFRGLPANIPVARYHSLAADAATLPDCLKVTARTDDNEIMAVAHKEHHIYGLQFHPESILTPEGKKIIENFFEI